MKTKLAAIYNLWDGCELLEGSMKCVKDHVDYFIIVYQEVSNFGEAYNPYEDILKAMPTGVTTRFVKYQPALGHIGSVNEANKRNAGIDAARSLNCTHFLHLDCDEYYEDFGALKEEYLQSGHEGSVCPLFTYFKSPILRLENMDGYFVPSIHELNPETQAGRSSYPFYTDPTRVINCSDVVKLSQPMHHFSWVRDDIERKARNSSAGQYGNRLKGLLADYHSPDLGEGYAIKDMGGQKLKIVPDIFGLLKK